MEHYERLVPSWHRLGADIRTATAYGLELLVLPFTNSSPSRHPSFRMNRTLHLVLLLVAMMALLSSVDAACKVKSDDTTGKEADNKIQDAPAKRATNKISFDVVDERKKRLANKIAFDVPTNATSSDEDDDGTFDADNN